MGILHVWILHIGIFPVWIIPVWQTGLRHLIDVELRADHSALIISATVTDKVAVSSSSLSAEVWRRDLPCRVPQDHGWRTAAVVEGQHL